jgi:hypothetical protein
MFELTAEKKPAKIKIIIAMDYFTFAIYIQLLN